MATTGPSFCGKAGCATLTSASGSLTCWAFATLRAKARMIVVSADKRMGYKAPDASCRTAAISFHATVITCLARDGVNKQSAQLRTADYLSANTPDMAKIFGGVRQMRLCLV